MEPQRHALLIGVSVSPQIYQYPCFRIRGSYQQLSSDRDVDLMHELLVNRFEFPEQNTRTLKTYQATRKAILAAVAELSDRVNRDDVVVLYYSGHGSRIPALGRETIVPFDASRRELENWDCKKVTGRLCTDGRSLAEVPGGWEQRMCGRRRWWGPQPPGESPDVQDLTIDGWIRDLNQKTPFVTLIFDCCHSGSISRPVGTVREVVPDLWSGRELDDPQQPPTAADSRIREEEQEGSGWLPEGRRAVVVAACRASEYAWERSESPKHGVLTYHLHRTLDEHGPRATWVDVLEAVAPRVNREQLAQHPQVEGETDLFIFSRRKARRSGYLPVSAVDAEGVDLWGGAALGVSPGSLWTVRSSDARNRFEGDQITKIRITEVTPCTCRGQVIEDCPADRLEPWQRAFLLEQSVPAPGLRVAIVAPEDRRRRLAESIGESPLLAVVENPRADGAGSSEDDDQGASADSIEGGDSPTELEDGVSAAVADVTAVCLAPRDSVADEPCPLLGPLEEWAWAVVDGDGQLQVRRRSHDEAGIESLVEDLVKLARFRGLRQMTHPDPESRLHDRVDLRILHQSEEGAPLAVAPVDPEFGVAVIEDGARVDFEIESRHDELVWVSLLMLDPGYSISLRLPWPEHPYYSPGGYELEPGQLLRLGRDYTWDEQGLPAHLPEGFPWSTTRGRGPEVGIYTFKLLVTTVRAPFEFFEQWSARCDDAPVGRSLGDDHSLKSPGHLFPSNSFGRSGPMAPESSPKRQDWAVVTRELGIRRKPDDE